MAPKKAAGATTKKPASSATHGTYKDMIKVAVLALKDRTGSSRQAIKKYIQANNNLGGTTEAALSKHISTALASGEKSGEFVRPKGPSGPVKLGKTSKPATKKATTTKAKTATKKTATTTTTATKKTTTAKKPASSSTKANSAKPRKSAPKKPTTAPAVAEKKPTIIGHTKSGRVQKTTAPQPVKKTAATKKSATKKAAPKAAA